ncbi:hypothetical protein CN918_30810 [Priestia megaterium]|nr:hypothetical protein CN918_30810 [Priestia megaterium]
MLNEPRILKKEEVENIVKELIRTKSFCLSNGTRFSSNIYVLYDAKLTEQQLIKIAYSDSKQDAFYDVLSDYACECQDDNFDSLLKTIEENWDEEEHGDYDEHESHIREFVKETVDFNFPYEHYLKQKINVNIIVDTGDGIRDYTCNNIISCSNSDGKEKDIDERSSLLWLAQQQGYTKEQLLDAVIHDNTLESTFLQTVRDESRNIASLSNALCLFVKMTLEQYMEISNNENEQPLSLDKTTSCGLFDTFHGAGSLLTIELEKNVVIPASYIKLRLDEEFRFSVSQVYGVFDDFWKETIIEEDHTLENKLLINKTCGKQ